MASETKTARPAMLRRSSSVEIASVLHGSAVDDDDISVKERIFSPKKAVLHGVLAFFLYVWWDLCGVWILPLYMYLLMLLAPFSFGHWNIKDRMEVRSVVIIYLVLVSIPATLVWCLLCRNRYVMATLAVYVAWYSLIDDAPQSGKRFAGTLRRRAFWRHFAAYFPMKLTRTVPLDPKRNYIFGYHPHGIISVGALCNFATEATGFADLFPGIDLRLLTLAMNFKVPIFREYLLGLGVNDVSRKSCERNLSRKPGASIMIVVGGARESLETKPGSADLVLEHRKGFVKMALKKGASLVPVFSFGENDVFGVYHNEKLMDFQLKMQKKLGFAFPIFFGRALTGGLLHRLFGLNVGLMPLRVPIHSVVGKPVHLETVHDPTPEQIDEAHAKYVEELKRVYNDWVDAYEKEREEALKTYDPERLNILRDSKFELDSREELSLVE